MEARLTTLTRLLSMPWLARWTERLTRPSAVVAVLATAWVSVLVALLLADSGLFFAISAGIGVSLVAAAITVLAPALRGDAPEQLFRLSPPRVLAAMALISQILLLFGYFWRASEFRAGSEPTEELRKLWHAVAGEVSSRRAYPDSLEALGAFRPGAGLDLVFQPGRADHPGRSEIIVAYERKATRPTEIRLFGAKLGRLVLFHDGRVQRLPESRFVAARDADRQARSADGWPPPR